MESRLEFTDVSESYATSIHNDVREIVHGYLADEKHRYNEFYFDNLEYAGKPLDLFCEVKRLSNKVLLSVRITRYETQDVLLSFDTTAPFFRPEVAVASFATTFTEKFSEQVVRQCSYTVPPQGFNAGPTIYLSLGNVLYGNHMTYPDLTYDIERTEGMPVGIMRDYEEFQTALNIRKKIFYTSAAACGGILIAGVILAGFEEGGVTMPEWSIPVFLTVFSVAGGINIVTGMSLLIGPKRKLLNILSPLNENPALFDYSGH